MNLTIQQYFALIYNLFFGPAGRVQGVIGLTYWTVSMSGAENGHFNAVRKKLGGFLALPFMLLDADFVVRHIKHIGCGFNAF